MRSRGDGKRQLLGSGAFWIGLAGGLIPQLFFWIQLVEQARVNSDEGRQYLSYLAFGPALAAFFCVLLGAILYLVAGSVRPPGAGLLIGTGTGLVLYALTCRVAGASG